MPARSSALAHKLEISFCQSADKINIAYAEVGNGPALIKAANWLTHLEYDWESPVWSPLLQRLAEKNRLIRYDTRGTGLSDRKVAEISFDGFVCDFESVVEVVNADRFAILGISQGAAVAVSYAVAHPERVTKLILYGGYALGRNKRGSADEVDKGRLFLSLMQHGWGDEHSAFMRAFSSLFIPMGRRNSINGSQTCNTGPQQPKMARAFDSRAMISTSPRYCPEFRCRPWCYTPGTTMSFRWSKDDCSPPQSRTRVW
jgi:pimeloyl-ACP methyl ester carboxylesterase